MIMAPRQTHTHTLPLFDHFLTNLLISSLASHHSSYPDAQLTRCGTTAWQLGLAWLLLKSKQEHPGLSDYLVAIECKKTLQYFPCSSGYTRKYLSDIYSITVIVTPSFYVPCGRLRDIIPCNRCHTKIYLIYSIAAIGTRRFQ